MSPLGRSPAHWKTSANPTIVAGLQPVCGDYTASLTSLQSLSKLDLGFNFLTGPAPVTAYQVSSWQLSSNFLTGQCLKRECVSRRKLPSSVVWFPEKRSCMQLLLRGRTMPLGCAEARGLASLRRHRCASACLRANEICFEKTIVLVPEQGIPLEPCTPARSMEYTACLSLGSVT